MKDTMMGGKVEPEIKVKLDKMSRALGRSKIAVLAALVDMVDAKAMEALRRRDWSK